MRTGFEASAAINKLRLIPPDEPVFIARGQDLLGPETARQWARMAYDAGVPACRVELALQQADRMEAWPVKKLPDADDIPDPAPLEAALALRVWSRVAAPPIDILTAAKNVARSEGFVAGVRSLQGPLDRLRNENADLRREVIQLEERLRDALQRAKVAEGQSA